MLIRAVEEAKKDKRVVLHPEMRNWLLRIAAGEFDAKPPQPRLPDPGDQDFPPSDIPARYLLDDDDAAAAKADALALAVAEARANQREVPHSEMRAWLLEVAAGNFDAPRPIPRIFDR